MADPIWQEKFKKFIALSKNGYSRVFGVADYESSFKIKKILILDPIWRQKLKNFDGFG